MHKHKVERVYARTVAVVRAHDQHLICRITREDARAKVEAGIYAPLGKPHKPITRVVPASQAIERAKDKQRGRERLVSRIDMPKPTTTDSENDENVKNCHAHISLEISEYSIFRAPRLAGPKRSAA